MSSNPYDDIVADLRTTPEPPRPTTNPYDEMFGERAAVARAAVSRASAVNPDTVAAQRRLAQFVQVNLAVGEAVPDEVKRLAAIKRVEEDTAQAPVLRQRFADENFAKIAHDDSTPLSTLEKSVGNAVRYMMGASEGGGLPGDAVTFGRSIASAAPKLGAGIYKLLAAPFGLADSGLQALDDLAAAVTNTPRRQIVGSAGPESSLRALGAQADKEAERWMGLHPDAGFIRRAVMSGAQSAGQNLMALPLGLYQGAASMLGLMGATAFGHSYGKARDAGVAPLQAAAYGAQDATAEVVTERFLGAAGFLKNVKAGSSAGKLFAYEVFREVPGEMLATLWQQFNEWTNINPEKSINDFVSELPEELAATVIATLVGGSTQIGAVKAVERIVSRATTQAADVQAAQQTAAELQNILALAAGSKLRERAPDSLAAFVQEVADEAGGAPAQVFIDAATLAGEGGVLNQDEVAKVLPSAAAELAEALATGGDVAIPVGELVAAIAGTPLEQKLLPHLRATPEAVSQAEAEKLTEQAQVFLQNAAQTVIDSSSNALEAQASADRVQAAVLQQLQTAGRFTKDVNQAYSSLVRSFYVVLGERIGKTAEEVMAAYPLRVAGVAPTTADLTQSEQPAGETDTPEFKAWFGDSKVVNEQGEPLVVYTGTSSDADFVKFRAPRNGVWFTADTETASGYAIDNDSKRLALVDGKYVEKNTAARVIPVYLNLQNPKVYEQWPDELRLANNYRKAQGVLFDQLKAQGYDGVFGPGNTYVAFRPEQIKSAIGNSGAFDPNDPNILHQRAVGDTKYQQRAIELAKNEKAPRRSAVAFMSGEVRTPLLPVNEDIFAFFTERNRRGMEDWPSRPAVKRMVAALRAEALHALSDAGSAVGWYGRKVKAAFDILAQLHPEVATDEEARFGFTVMLGITSNMTAVNQNFEEAEALYRQWKETDVWPTSVQAAQAAEAKGIALVKVGELIAKHGWEKARDFLTSKHTKEEIEAFTGYEVPSESAGEVVYGAAYLGSKIGTFINNLYGNFDSVTMDRWFMRSINRIRGAMLSLPGTFSDTLAALPDSLQNAQAFGYDASQVSREVAKFLSLPEEARQDVIVARNALPTTLDYLRERVRVYARGTVDSAGVRHTYSPRTHENVQAKQLFEALTLDDQTPAGGGERRLLRGIMREVQQGLHDDGIPIELADLQTVLWYFEKDLFARLKNAQAELFDAAAAGEEVGAEDYETAAQHVARLRGLVLGPGAERAGSGRAGKRAAAARGPDVRAAADIAADQPLAGLPAVVRVGDRDVTFGPFAPARAAAERYMARAGLPEPALAQGPRGSFNPSTLTITLLETADLSTFLHETGHFFLTVMADVASQPGAPLGVREDMQKLLDWFGVKDLATWNGMKLDEQRPHHERFAQSFEQYLFEGKAPDTELRPLFRRFRSWMLNVYQSLTRFLAANETKLTDEVRGVFDRLLAVDDAIHTAEAERQYLPMFDSAAAAGMTDEEWAAYQAEGAEATARAQEKLQKRSLLDIRWRTRAHARKLRELQADARAKRDAVEAEIKAELAATPIERARAHLRELRATSPEDKAALKDWKARREDELVALRAKVREEFLAQTEARELKGLAKGQFLAKNAREIANEAERRLLAWERANPRPRRATAAVDLEAAAAQFGFTSGDELRIALDETPSAAELLEPLTDRRMLERYGDLTDPQQLRRAADEAVHNDARARFLATGMRALGDTRPARVLTAMARLAASELVAGRKVRALAPGRARVAETRAGKTALAATAAGKTREAAVAQRDQLMNHYLARLSTEALAEVDKGVAYLRKLASGSTLPPDYQEQIDTLLERFDLRETSQKTAERRRSLAEWVDAQRQLGIEPELPPGLLDEARRQNYRDLTVEEFRGLVDTVKQIEHLGRLKGKLLTAKDQRDFEAVRDALTASIVANAAGRKADTRTPTTNLGRWLQAVRNFGAAHIKAATLARVLDGGKDGGPMWETFVRSANAAGDMETTMRAQATKDLTRILAPLFDGGKLGGKGRYFPSVGRSLNKESVVAIALNVGNASNLQRLLGGEGWTEDQLKPVLASLTESEWGVVQKVWDYFESYRPLIADKEKRVRGVEPKWIERRPFDVELDNGQGQRRTISLRGGYYPVKYDPAASVRAEEHADADGARRQLQGAYGASTTRRSFTKTRAEEVHGRPLLYTLAGLYTGVNDVIHDLAWHEWLIDANRLLKSESVDQAIRQHYGPAVVRQLKSWRDAVAEGEGGATEALDRALGALRQNVSVAGLGFNLMSALQQPLGLTQSMVRVGAQWIGKGLMHYIANPLGATRTVQAQSEFMKHRAQTRFRELNELRNKVQGQEKIATRYAYWLMTQVQQMVDVPTWLGAYEKAVAEGNDDERARALADQAVIDAQGSGQIKDTSAIERGGPAQKLFTVFYNFMNTALNAGYAAAQSPQSRAKKAADMLLLYTVPALLGYMLKHALTPGDADEDWAATARKLLAEQLNYLMGLMVLVREFAAAAKVAVGFEDPIFGYGGPAGTRVIKDVSDLAKQTSQGEFDDGFRKAFINVLGDLTGIPSAQANRTITGAKALVEGKTYNPAALLFGHEEPR